MAGAPSAKTTSRMGLFGTLTSQASETVKKSLDLPTVVQLYHQTPLRLETTADIPSWAVTTYSAVPLESSGAVELGVWNCAIASRESSISDQLDDSLRTFCLTVDLAHPHQVEPTLSLLQDALVHRLIDRPPTGDLPASATTSLYTLRSTTFGLAAEDDPSSLQGAAPAETDRAIGLCLVICARLAPPTDDYATKQTQLLLQYHLRRYAAALSAFLCFVSDEGSTGAGDDDQPALTPTQVALLWRQVALGHSPESIPELASSSDAAHSRVYSVENHNTDWIESVLLRSAHYPGQWDASKDSLWKILPSTPVTAPPTTSSTNPQSAGDQDWLKELRESLGSEPAKTTPRKTPTKEAANKATPSDKNVSSFFESLLK